MKVMPIRIFQESSEPGQRVTTLTLLRMALDAPSREGLSIADIRARLRVHDAIDKAEEVGAKISLEDADFAALLNIWRATPWSIPNRHLVAVDDDLTAAVNGK